ncbi:MAG: hypothetical protein KI786_11185 [Mameliella sp.]|nr:hypothetical protein [Phaeodactylibacter sp.]
MADQPVRTRFAPTPSGLLHPGNGLSFILTWVLAKGYDGKILLRIDDLDKERTRQAFIEDVFRTIDWLGLDYDEGPSGVDDFLANWSQHTRLDNYRSALQRLQNEGQLFACNCTRKQIRQINPDGRYPGTCLGKEHPFSAPNSAWRIHAPGKGAAVALNHWGEGLREMAFDSIDAFVVRQKNGFPAYQLASLIDDQLFDIDLIVRGADLWASTLSQLYLADVLEVPSFTNSMFWHHPLLKGPDGEKLSKSKGAGSLKEWRESGRSATALYKWAAAMVGVNTAPDSAKALLESLKDTGVFIS